MEFLYSLVIIFISLRPVINFAMQGRFKFDKNLFKEVDDLWIHFALLPIRILSSESFGSRHRCVRRGLLPLLPSVLLCDTQSEHRHCPSIKYCNERYLPDVEEFSF